MKVKNKKKERYDIKTLFFTKFQHFDLKMTLTLTLIFTNSDVNLKYYAMAIIFSQSFNSIIKNKISGLYSMFLP